MVLAAILIGVVLSFGPGFFAVRRFGWPPLEALTASVGLSLILLFVASFAAHWMDAGLWADWAIGGVGMAMTALAWKEACALFRDPTVRRLLGAFLGLAVWTVLVLSLIGQYGGGDWCCDWLEHYQRTQHFITPWPSDFRFIDLYPLSTRPPLMNAVAAQLARPAGLTFPVYQVVFSLLNLLVLLSCCLISGLVSRRGIGPADPRLMAVMLALNPVFFMNTTYAWTKGLTAFFVLLGVSLYVTGRRLDDPRRMAASFLAMAAAVLSHYSAVPVAAILALHYVVVAAPWRAGRRLAVVRMALPGALLLGIWFAYDASTSGLAMLRNASVEGTRERSVSEHVETRLLNLRDTFIPRRYEGYNGYPEDASRGRRFADQVFTWYQGNLLLSMGSLAGLLTVVLAVRGFRRSPTSDRWFWAVGIGWLSLTGVLVHGDRAESGLALIALQPITYVGLAFLATRLVDLPRWVRLAWFAALIVDGMLGVALPVLFERGSGEWARTPNWALKADAGVTFFGDLVTRPWMPVVLLGTLALVGAAFCYRYVVPGAVGRERPVG